MSQNPYWNQKNINKPNPGGYPYSGRPGNEYGQYSQQPPLAPSQGMPPINPTMASPGQQPSYPPPGVYPNAMGGGIYPPGVGYDPYYYQQRPVNKSGPPQNYNNDKQPPAAINQNATQFPSMSDYNSYYTPGPGPMGSSGPVNYQQHPYGAGNNAPGYNYYNPQQQSYAQQKQPYYGGSPGMPQYNTAQQQPPPPPQQQQPKQYSAQPKNVKLPTSMYSQQPYPMSQQPPAQPAPQQINPNSPNGQYYGQPMSYNNKGPGYPNMNGNFNNSNYYPPNNNSSYPNQPYPNNGNNNYK